MEESYQEKWRRFLTPQILRSNMIIASVYIATFEILKNCIIDRLRDFYWSGWETGHGDIIDPTYYAEVLSKNRSQLFASLLWLKENEVIDDADLKIFEKVKEVRNQIAHEISRLLSDGLPNGLPERFSEMVSLLLKIEKWWIVNVEIQTDSYLADKDIDENGIIPGTVASVKMMVDIALGTDEQAVFYLKGFIDNGLI